MDAFNIIPIIIGLLASIVFGYLIADARRPGQDEGLFIDHETLGKMRESWIEYGRRLERDELKEEGDGNPTNI